MSDRLRTAIVSAFLIFGYLIFGYLLLTGYIKPNVNGEVALVLVGGVFGVLTTGFILAVAFELGSSAGSRSKDALIAGQLPPLPVPPAPSPPIVVAPPKPPTPLLPTQPLPKPPPKPALPSNVLTIVGKMSDFGGPKDTGVSPVEGLALCEPNEIGLFPGLFLPADHPDLAGATGLARRLDPTKLYIACRWNYKQTPRSWLQKTKVRCTSGRITVEGIQPIDWGPNENTGRVADLSPGLEAALGLTTGGTVTVEVPLPPGSPAPDAPISEDAIPHLKVLTNQQLDEKFGPFPYTEGPAGTIRPDPAWVAANIVTVVIPQLAHLVHGGSVQCHKAAAEPLKAVFADLEAAGLMSDILTFDGLWVPRHIGSDPRRGISRHSRGLALDINAEWNPYGGMPAARGVKGNCWRLAPIFEKHGFAWGAWFGRSSLDGPPASDTDGMHYEYIGS